MRILIYGAGAVGLGLASCLLKSEKSVDIIGREDTVSALSIDGLERIGIFSNFHAPPWSFNTFTKAEELDGEPYDFILVCTKSFDTETAAEALSFIPKLRHDDTHLVLCQNGWGNGEIFSTFFPSEQIKNARIITGFRRPKPNQVDITVHADTVHLGSLFNDPVEPLEPLARAIDEGGIPCRVSEHLEQDLWAKMLYNCMLNGLSTLFGVPYGHLGDSDHTRELMDAIAFEVFEVMHAAGFTTHWPSADEYLEVFYEKHLPPTYKHEPSMLQDIRAKKRTEIAALNGAVVELGNKHEVSTPHNLSVHNMIRFLERKGEPV